MVFAHAMWKLLDLAFIGLYNAIIVVKLYKNRKALCFIFW